MLDHMLTVSAVARHTGWLKELVIKTKTMKTEAAPFDLITFLNWIQFFIFAKCSKNLATLQGWRVLINRVF